MTEQEYYKCLSVIDSFASLSKNWNGYDADPIPDKVFTYSKKLLLYLISFNITHQLDCPAPEIFPTANHSIQFEWHMNDDKYYMELEVGENTIDYFAEFDRKNYNNHSECHFIADLYDYSQIIWYIKEVFFIPCTYPVKNDK